MPILAVMKASPPFKGKWGREKFKDLPCQRNDLLLAFVLEVPENNKKFIASQAGKPCRFRGRKIPAGGRPPPKAHPHRVPWVSLTILKRSRSIYRTATTCFLRRALTRACDKRSRAKRRLGSFVKLSKWASWIRRRSYSFWIVISS